MLNLVTAINSTGIAFLCCCLVEELNKNFKHSRRPNGGFHRLSFAALEISSFLCAHKAKQNSPYQNIKSIRLKEEVLKSEHFFILWPAARGCRRSSSCSSFHANNSRLVNRQPGYRFISLMIVFIFSFALFWASSNLSTDSSVVLTLK